MRKMILLILLLLSTGPEKSDFIKETQELQDMIHFTEENNLEVAEWEMTFRANVSEGTFYEFLDEKNGKNQVMKREEDDISIYTFIEWIEKPQLEIKYDLHLVKDPLKRYDIIVTVKSQETTETAINQYNELIKSKIFKYILDNVNIYTCLRVEKNDIMNRINIEEKIVKMFNLEDVEKYNDDLRKEINVKEIYGYNKNWNDYLVVLEEPINFHAVFLEKENGSELIIGTPILIHEY